MSKLVVGQKRHADGAGLKTSKKIRTQKDGVVDRSKAIPLNKRSFGNGRDKTDDFESFDEINTVNQNGDDAGSLSPPTKSASHSVQQDKNGVLNGQSSREAHAKQKALTAERRAAKPNADSVARTKKIWERLRIKSAVPKEEREKLVKELFEIITGRVKEFVFKHDSVRVIQCALKYASPDQKKSIAHELKGSYRELAESKYAKFLIAKMIVGDNEIRDLVVPEIYGHVKRLMRHPEAGWIVDDIYRGLATKDQKARLLREWYGAEFVVFRSGKDEQVSAELSTILSEFPEKRGSIMQHLKEMTNQLVQKKATGFTMLHDALLQYFLNTKPGSPEATEFLDMLKDDEEGDLYKNLAFTKSGSRLVCLALAYGSSKDRRTILKFFKTHIKMLSGDQHGFLVLVTAYEVVDDTVMSSKAIFPELLSKDMGEEERTNELLSQATHLTARIPLLYLLSLKPPKWLITDDDRTTIDQVKEIRKETSKKDPETRRTELVKAISQPLLDLIASQVEVLVQSSFGCQFITEVLIGAVGEKESALKAVVTLAQNDTENNGKLLSSPHAGRMLKTLVQGGRFNKTTKQIELAEPRLDFGDLLFTQLAAIDDGLGVLKWATGPNSFAIVAMLESPNFASRGPLDKLIDRYQNELKNLQSDDKSTNTGARIILEKAGIASKPKLKPKK